MISRKLLRTAIAVFAITLSVAVASFAAAKKRTPTDLAPESTVWVGKSDQSLSCEKGNVEIDTMAKELSRANIQILEQKKASDGKMHAQMCGMDKGVWNLYRIKQEDLKKALILGFSTVPKP